MYQYDLLNNTVLPDGHPVYWWRVDLYAENIDHVLLIESSTSARRCAVWCRNEACEKCTTQAEQAREGWAPQRCGRHATENANDRCANPRGSCHIYRHVHFAQNSKANILHVKQQQQRKCSSKQSFIIISRFHKYYWTHQDYSFSCCLPSYIT